MGIFLLAIIYLLAGAMLAHMFVWSGRYNIKATKDRKVNTWFKLEKSLIITLIWPYVIIKGLIDSAE